MIKRMWLAAVAVVVCVGSVQAEGLPSQSKLAKLGLGSMNIVADQRGDEVRGQGFGATTILFALNATVGIGNTASATGTQSSVFGQDARFLGEVSFGGNGFGGFADSTAPDFSTYVSTPITVSTAGGGVTSVSSIQGFMWGIGR